MCRNENCTCFQHQILDYLEKGLDEEAKLALEEVENFYELTDDSGWTLLHYSVKYRNAEMAQYLIEQGCEVNAQDDAGVTALMLAVKARDVIMVEVLFKNNADIYTTDSGGMSSLELAFYLSDKSLFLILDLFFGKINNAFLKGELTQVLYNTNNSIKFIFVVFGNIEMARFIIRNCYSIDFREPGNDRTALHYAILYARFENARILIEHGANTDALDKDERSPLRYYSLSRFEKVDEKLEVLNILLKCSTSLYTPGQFGLTDVESVLLMGGKETVRAVLLSDVDLNVCFKRGKFLIHILTSNSNVDVLDILDELNIKFDVNERATNDGQTALMVAACRGCIKKLEFLLERNADANLKTSSGYSALTYTDANKNSKVIELLLQHGADAQTFFSDRPYLAKKYTLGAEVIVAHLAMLGTLEPSVLPDSSLNIVESQPRLKAYFDLCTKQLEAAKYCEIYGTVTLFKLLSEKEDKIVAYARNADIIAAFTNAIRDSVHLEQYYINTLQRKISRGLAVANLQEKAALTIEILIGLCTERYFAIVYNIIRYLEHQDLQNLCKIADV